MEEHFVNYTQALALKELGFNEPCWCYFVNDVFFDSMFPKDYDYFEQMNKKMEYTLTPLKSQVFKWLRDEHKLIAYIEHYAEWNFEIFRIDDKIAEVQDDVCFDYTFKGGTYEEAESACIDKLIELIKEKKS